MKKGVFAIGLLIVVGIFVFYLMSSSQKNVSSTGNTVSEDSQSVGTGVTKTFVVDSSHLRFYIDGVENPSIKVNDGDKVRIEFSSSEGFHDWRVDEFNAFTEKVKEGEKSSVEFIADKKGTFEYYCSVGKHRENGMNGKLIVE